MKDAGREKNGKFIKGRKMPQEEVEKLAEAQQGNQNRCKLKSAELQMQAYLAYCQWIAAGWSARAFVFDYIEEDTGKEGSITARSIERYIKDPRYKLPPEHKERAEALAFQQWEVLGVNMMKGQVEKCQPAIYQMMMRNKFGWDKETKSTNIHEADAKKFMQYCDNIPDPDSQC